MSYRRFDWFLLLTLVLLSLSCQTDRKKEVALSDKQPGKITEELIQSVVDLSVAQYKYLATKVPAGKLPRTYLPASDSLIFSETKWWTSGFYPGTLLYLFELSGDSLLYEKAMQKLELLEVEKNNTKTHDLGFMLYCSFGHANRLDENPYFTEVLLTGAESLATRFSPKTGVIRSWDHGEWKYPVIIDNMMNLEFLFWATRESGDAKYRQMAISHADSTIKNHFREDHSTFHVIDYDSETGKVIARKTHQGKADESAWSRGQAWAVYGFTVMYRETGDKKYREQAEKMADYILLHPNMPEDLVPYWDYDEPASDSTYRDASAAAITASALLELSKLTEDNEKQEFYRKSAETMILSLSSEDYLAPPQSNGGFILKHSVGSLPHRSEVDVPLTYADYYYLEALKRYQDWYL